jgi:ring-1,2-phenylacetyl-CoA epoxidase subunit PaaC
MVRALDELWMYTGEMFLPTEYEMEMQKSGIGPELLSLRQQWNEKVKEVFGRAGLDFPGLQAEKDGQAAAWMQQGGKSGIHSEHLGYILAELQFMQRAYPGNEW